MTVVVVVALDVVAAAQLTCRLSSVNGSVLPTTDQLLTGAVS